MSRIVLIDKRLSCIFHEAHKTWSPFVWCYLARWAGQLPASQEKSVFVSILCCHCKELSCFSLLPITVRCHCCGDVSLFGGAGSVQPWLNNPITAATLLKSPLPLRQNKLRQSLPMKSIINVIIIKTHLAAAQHALTEHWQSYNFSSRFYFCRFSSKMWISPIYLDERDFGIHLRVDRSLAAF